MSKTQDTAPKGLLEESRVTAALREQLRRAVQEAIVGIATEELAAVLEAGKHERTEERRGYRHGTVTRAVTTTAGQLKVELPRARLNNPDGSTREWTSAVVPRYQRRTADVDEAIVRCYLAGVNTRKIRTALQPLIDGAALSRSAVSRIVGRLQSRFDEWRTRSLADERIVALYLDAILVKVRHGKRMHLVPVLAALGVRDTGERLLLHLELVGSESTAAWQGFVEQLAGRGLSAPRLVIIDGNRGLRRAIRETWPQTRVQRCTVHKWLNLEGRCPKELCEELRTDYRHFVYAESADAVRTRYAAFLAKWTKLCPSMKDSLAEAGDELITFTHFPKACWKALRTTNAIERLNGEFRRRVKTQGTYPTDDAVLVLFFGLLASGVVKLRRLVGHEAWVQHMLADERQVA
jgi:transposase-like protein